MKTSSFWCSDLTVDNIAVNKGFSHLLVRLWLNSDDMYLSLGIKTVVSIMSALPQVEWLTPPTWILGLEGF